MLSRIIPKSSHLRFLTIIHSQIYLRNPRPQIPSNPLSSITYPHLYFHSRIFHFYSTTTTNNNNNNINNNDNENGKDLSTNFWKLSSETDQSIDSIFGLDSEGFLDHKQLVKKSGVGSESWSSESLSSSVDGDDDRLFREVVVEGEKDVGDHKEGWTSAEVSRPWSFAGDDQEDDLFDVGGGKGEREGESAELELEGLGGSSVEEELESKKSEEKKKLEAEEKVLTAILKGPNHSFGDLIAASGITDAMLDSLIALKDLEGIEGLPPLREIEDMRYEKSMKRSTRAEIERQKQEEVAKARVRQVDEKGRAYGTGRRKCSIARVWVQPGNGKLVVNDKEFDVYFPMLDHRASILRPFSETKTLGMWDVFCTVKGGGVSGQVGAIQLGISRALQNWAPDLRPPLREAGFLTRDSRVVERKKPGKAKARKSFQWVKR